MGNQSSRKSPYKGVSWTKDTRYKGGGYWYARIMIDGKQYWRSAATEVEAAQKYNEMAKEHAGEFARPNGLVLVYVSCRFCGAPYQREIEPEYARLVQQHGICDACMELHEQARCMEVENGCS